MSTKTVCDSCGEQADKWLEHNQEIEYKVIKKKYYPEILTNWEKVDLCFSCFKSLKSIGDKKCK